MAVLVDSDSLDNSSSDHQNGKVAVKLKEDQLQLQTPKLPYPKSVLFVVVTEFCERFAYYGMRAVLTIYMRNVLNFGDDLATTVYHIFLFLCYFLPVFGAILADSFIGKYNTVFALSSIFAMGSIMLTAASTPPLQLPVTVFSLGGLFFMAIGTGGIKPCVVALGGDQFILPQQEIQLKQFFSIFVFAVSVGNMVSTVITPVLRSDVQCFSVDCYPLAFGIPALLMIVAVVIFVSGKSMYKINQPKDNIILRVAQCITHAVSQRQKEKKKKTVRMSVDSTHSQEHWIDYAHYDGSKFDNKLIEDTKGLLRVLVYYLPVPMFWALYEQLGSRWTLQATRMNGNVGFFTIKPDQMQVANAILMFIFIPVFETVLYPLLRKCHLLKRPLQRMGVGGLLAALSFLLAGYTELRIEKSSMELPGIQETYLNVINTLPCRIIVTERTLLKENVNTSANLNEILTVEPETNFILRAISGRNVTLGFAINSTHPTSCPTPMAKTFNYSMSWSDPIFTLSGQVQSIIVTLNSVKNSLELSIVDDPEDIKKSKEGYSKLKIIRLHSLSRDSFTEKGSNNGIENNSTTLNMERIKLIRADGKVRYYEMHSSAIYSFMPNIQIKPDGYQIHLEQMKDGSNWKDLEHVVGLHFETGGNYIVIIKPDTYDMSKLQDQLVTIIPPNEIHMLWLLPQYVVMAWAEILFIISGMEFSFTEAPISMKSVLQSCWHLTNAAGNLLVIIAAQVKGNHSQATEFLVFASLMIVDILIFAWMASRYTYVSEMERTDSTDPGSDQPDSELDFLQKNPHKDHNFIIPTIRITEETHL